MKYHYKTKYFYKTDGTVCVEIGQRGGGEHYLDTFGKVAFLQTSKLRSLTVFLDDVIHNKMVTDLLFRHLAEAAPPDAVDITLEGDDGHIGPLADIQPKTMYRDYVDRLLGVITENPRLHVRSLDCTRSVSPSHGALMAFIQAKERQLTSLWVDDIIDVDQPASVIHGSIRGGKDVSAHDPMSSTSRWGWDPLVEFDVSSDFLPKLLRVRATDRPVELVVQPRRSITPDAYTTLMHYMLHEQVVQAELDFNHIDLTRILEASRRNPFTRKLKLSHGTLRGVAPSPLSDHPLPPKSCPAELVLKYIDFIDKPSGIFEMFQGYSKVTLNACEFTEDANLMDETPWPKCKCLPELEMRIVNDRNWALLHRVLEVQPVKKLTIEISNGFVPLRMPSILPFCQGLKTNGGIEKLKVIFRYIHRPDFMELFSSSLGEMKGLLEVELESVAPHVRNPVAYMREQDAILRPLAVDPTLAEILLESVKTSETLYHIGVEYGITVEDKKTLSTLKKEMELNFGLNRLRFPVLTDADEVNSAFPLGAWSHVVAAARGDPSVILYMLQRKLDLTRHVPANGSFENQILLQKQQGKGILAIKKDKPERGLEGKQLASLLWDSAASKAVSPALLLSLGLSTWLVMKS